MLLLWLALLAVFAPLGTKLPTVTTEEYSRPSGYQSAEVGRLLRERFPGGDFSAGLLVYRRPGGLTEEDRRAIQIDAREAVSIPLVRDAIPPVGPGARPGQVSRDGDVAFTVLGIAPGGVTELTDASERLREVAGGVPGLEAHVTGTAPLLNDMTNLIQEADMRLLLMTGLLVLVLLLVIYRSPLLALLPLVVVGTSYAIATGVIYVLAEQGLPVTSNSISLLLVLMFGVGTDYCLLLVSRYNLALRRHREHGAALGETVPLAAPVIAASGLTVIATVLTLLASVLSLNRAFAPVNAIGVAIVLVATLTLFPALLAVVGRAAFWPRPVAFDPSALADEASGTWLRIGRRVLQRPAGALAVGVAVLAVASLGVLTYERDANVIGQFRTETDGTRGYEVLRAAFPPGLLTPTTVLVERRTGLVRTADVRAVQKRLQAVPGVATVSGVQRRSTDGRFVSLDLIFAVDPYLNSTLDLVPRLRDAAAAAGGDLRVLFGEGTASRYDFREAADRDLKVVGPIALVVVFLMLVLLLRALVAPLYLLATVLLSFLGTLGLSLLLYKLILGRDSVDPELPLVAFIFLVALGSDYNIFLMSRVREEVATHGTREGIVRGLSATGSVITSAGVILAGTFAVLTVLPMTFLLELGIAVALGVLLDTFLVRTIVVPALGWLVADRSWWPFPPPAAGRFNVGQEER